MFLLLALALLSTLSNAAAAGAEGTWVQMGENIAEEGNYDSDGGMSFSADGNIMAIGASGNDGAGTNAGHVRVFEYTGGQWVQMGLDIDGKASYDKFGHTLALSADGLTLVVGAPKNKNGENKGNVQIYKYDPNSSLWVETGDIEGDGNKDQFGWSVGLSADGLRMVAGASAALKGDPEGNYMKVFEFVMGTWVQLGSTITGKTVGDQFGRTVAMSADGTHVAGGSGVHTGANGASGHVRVYEMQSGSWEQVGEDLDGDAAGDYFGAKFADKSGTPISLSADGKTIAIGAEKSDANGVDSGYVRVFESQVVDQYTSLSRKVNGVAVNMTVTWVAKGDKIEGESAGDLFGGMVSMSDDGSRLSISANGHKTGIHGSFNGQVRVYQWLVNIHGAINNGYWHQIGLDFDGLVKYAEYGNNAALSPDGSVFATRDTTSGAFAHAFKFDIADVDCAGKWMPCSSACETAAERSYIHFVNPTGNGQVCPLMAEAVDCQNGVEDCIEDIDCQGSWSACTSACETAAQRSFTTITPQSGNGIVCPAAENCQPGVEACPPDIDCSGTWTTCTAACELASERSFTTITQPSGNGQVCPVAIVDCKPGFGSLCPPDVDCVGSWSACTSACETSAQRSFTTITQQSGRYGKVCPVAAVDCQPGVEACPTKWGYEAAADTGCDLKKTTVIETLMIEAEEVESKWVQIGEDIIGKAPNDSGGAVSLSADGKMMAIGMTNNDDAGTNAGMVMVYKLSEAGAWEKIGQDIRGKSSQDKFGFDVALSADGLKLAVGAPKHDGIIVKGNVQTYVYDPTMMGIAGWGAWDVTGDIEGDGDGDNFGWSVDMSADGLRMVVGTTSQNKGGPGGNYMKAYEFTQGSWVQLGSTITGRNAMEQFGRTVTISDDGTHIAGGSGVSTGVNGVNSGYVRVYEMQSGSWEQVGEDIEGAAAGDFMGARFAGTFGNPISLSADGKKIAIGAEKHDANGEDSGHVRVFELQPVDQWSGAWVQMGQDILGEAKGDLAGGMVSMSADGSILSVSADMHNQYHGHFRVFEFQPLKVGTNGLAGSWVQRGPSFLGDVQYSLYGVNTAISADGSIMAARHISGNGLTKVFKWEVPQNINTCKEKCNANPACSAVHQAGNYRCILLSGPVKIKSHSKRTCWKKKMGGYTKDMACKKAAELGICDKGGETCTADLASEPDMAAKICSLVDHSNIRWKTFCGAACPGSETYTEHQNIRCLDWSLSVGSTMYMKTLEECKEACTAQSSCKSFYRRKKMCVMFSENLAQIGKASTKPEYCYVKNM